METDIPCYGILSPLAGGFTLRNERLMGSSCKICARNDPGKVIGLRTGEECHVCLWSDNESVSLLPVRIKKSGSDYQA